MDGNSHFYLVLDGNEGLFDASIANVMDIVRYQVGDAISRPIVFFISEKPFAG